MKKYNYFISFAIQDKITYSSRCFGNLFISIPEKLNKDNFLKVQKQIEEKVVAEENRDLYELCIINIVKL